MTFETIHKPSFDEDFVNLNKDLQLRIVRRVLPELRKSPDTVRGDTIKPLLGFERLWRYRIGDYRLIYAVYHKERLVQLLAIGPRGKVYKRFTYKPDESEFTTYARVLEDALHPVRDTPNELAKYFSRKHQEDDEQLPILLTRHQLQQWKLPEEYWHYFEHCRTTNDILNCKAPEEYISYILEQIWPTPMEVLAQQPNKILSVPEDLLRYADGDLIDFLLYLDDEQRPFIDWSLSGPTLLKGGPGSGKSTVALYRIQRLMEHSINANKKPRILFVTYTNALVNTSKELLSQLLGNNFMECNNSKNGPCIDILTLDKIVRQIVYDDDGEYLDIISSSKLKMVIDEFREQYKLLSGLTTNYLRDEIRWVLEGQNIRGLSAYLRTSRVGRKIPFNESIRREMWHLYMDVKRKLDAAKTYTWGGLRIRALDLLRSGKGGLKKWDYVIVDEAQDLPPVALSLAVEFCVDPAGLFLTADASQSIYNKGFAWSRVHESLKVKGRTRILRRNYRTTRQIAEAAHDFIQGTGVADEDNLRQTYVRIGPYPKMLVCNTEQMGFRRLAQEIRQTCQNLNLSLNAVAVLTRTHELANQAMVSLLSCGILARYVSGKDLHLNDDGVKVMTIYSAKGLEFPVVIVPYFEEGVFPISLDGASSGEMREIENQDIRLLYVAWTRAMHRLFVLYRASKESSFSVLIDRKFWEVEAVG